MTRFGWTPRVAAIVLAAAVAGTGAAADTDGVEPSVTGTYRLDAYVSDDPSDALDAALGGLTDVQRSRVRDRVLARMTPPRLLVIERQDRTIVVGSPLATKVQFEADGQMRDRSGADGSTTRVRAALSDSGFSITVEERGGDVFNSQYGLFDDGRKLALEYQAYVEEIAEPVVIQSVYVRTSSAPEWTTNAGR